MEKFRIYYDYRADEIIEIISEKLKFFGLKIEWIEADNDGFDEYIIKKIEE